MNIPPKCSSIALITLDRIITGHNRFLFLYSGAKVKKGSAQKEKQVQRHKIFYVENLKGKNHGDPQTLRKRFTVIERKYNKNL